MNKIASAALTAGLLFGCAKQEAPSSPIDRQPTQNNLDTKMPSELRDTLSKRDSSHIPLDTLMNLPFNEYDSRKIGENVLHYATIGVGQTEQTRIPAQMHGRMYKYFVDVANKAPVINYTVHPESVATTGSTNNKVSSSPNITARVSISPRNEDVYVISVPEQVSLGVMGVGNTAPQADAVTITEAKPIASFVKTMFQGSMNPFGVSVEACQSAIDAHVENTDDFPGVPIGELDQIAQEQVCNSLGNALAHAQFKTPYNVYAQGEVTNPRRMLGTVTPGYFGEIPYVDPELYSALQTNTVIDPNNHLIYPRFK